MNRATKRVKRMIDIIGINGVEIFKKLTNIRINPDKKTIFGYVLAKNVLNSNS
jgi:hypothetical protein